MQHLPCKFCSSEPQHTVHAPALWIITTQAQQVTSTCSRQMHCCMAVDMELQALHSCVSMPL